MNSFSVLLITLGSVPVQVSSLPEKPFQLGFPTMLPHIAASSRFSDTRVQKHASVVIKQRRGFYV